MHLPSVQPLRDALLRADYHVDPVLAAITPAGQAGLARNHSVEASRALTGNHGALATLIRLFILQQPQPSSLVEAALPTSALLDAGVLVPGPDGTIAAAVDIRPYADETDATVGWVVSDHAATLDTRPSAPRPDHVLGVSPASTTLSQLTIRRPVGTALDLGTGCGVQSLHLARHAGRVVATDLNPRALDMARLTLALSGVDGDVELRLGSLYEPTPERFDLIVTNPPFVMSPPGGERLAYRESPLTSDALMEAVVTGGARHLQPDGVLQVVGNWAHIAGQPWQERLAGWIPSGFDAVVLQREVLDPYEYVEIWLADAGLAGTPAYRARYDAWLSYFDGLGVEGIGMGWVTLVASGRADAVVDIEDWPHPVEQPVADAIADQVDAARFAALSDDEVLAAAWTLAPDTIQETMGRPGEADPSHVVLRRQRGLRRAVEVDTALGGTLGACDGDLPLGVIVDAVATLLDVDATALRADLVPRLRGLIADAWLTNG